MEYKTKTLYKDNKYLNLMETTCPDGKKWVYAKRVNTKGVVIIIPLIEENNELSTLFLKTKRPPLLAEGISEFNLEFPAGLVGDENSDETFEDALKKELLEETGYIADKFIIKNSKLSSSAGCVSEIATIAIALIKDSKIYNQPISDGGVIQERILVKFTEIRKFINSCQNKNWSIGAQTLGGIYYLYDECFNNKDYSGFVHF